MKAISAIVTTLLLIIIVISISSSVYFFYLETTEKSAADTEEAIERGKTIIGQKLAIDNAHKNEVFIRNTGSIDISGKELKFFVNGQGIDVLSFPDVIKPKDIATFVLNDTQLSLLPDPAELKITSLGLGDTKVVDFYEPYYVGYWKFDENSGIIAFDSSRNDNNGNINGAIWNTSCKFGSCLTFDGVDDFVITENYTGMPPQNFTVEAWVSIRSKIFGSMIVSKGAQYWLFFDVPGDRPTLAIIPGLGLSQNSTVHLNDNTFYHLVGTYDGSFMRLYVDGNLINSTTHSTNLTNDPIRIGGGSLAGFDGTIDEVRIMNIARPMG